MNRDWEKIFWEFWAHVSIPEGYYTDEMWTACLHTQEISCDEATKVQLHISEAEAEAVPDHPTVMSALQGLIERGGMVLGDPAIREGHRVILIAIAIPEEFQVEQHPDGYWVASMVKDFREEEDKGAEDRATDDISRSRSPFTRRLTHESTGVTKNEAVRDLIQLVNWIHADRNQAPIEVTVISPDMLGMGPGDRFLDPNSRN